MISDMFSLLSDYLMTSQVTIQSSYDLLSVYRECQFTTILVVNLLHSGR